MAVLGSPTSYGFGGCKTTWPTELKLNCVKVEVAVPNSPYGLGDVKATWNSNNSTVTGRAV